MQKKQDSRLTMFIAIILYLNANLAKLEKYPRIRAVVTYLEDLVRLIKAAAKKQGTIANGVTATKLKARETLLLFCNRVRLAVIVAANDAGDEKLKTKMDVPLTDLKDKRDAELQRFVEIVLDEAKNNAKAITESGIDDEVLAEYGKTVEEFTTSLNEQNQSLTGRVGSTGDLEKLLKQGMTQVRETLDGLMEGFKTTDPAFYEEYRLRRTIKELGIRHDQEQPPPPAETPAASTAAPEANAAAENAENKAESATET